MPTSIRDFTLAEQPVDARLAPTGGPCYYIGGGGILPFCASVATGAPRNADSAFR